MTCEKCGGGRISPHMVWSNGGFAPALRCEDCNTIQGTTVNATAEATTEVVDEPATPRRRRATSSEEPANG